MSIPVNPSSIMIYKIVKDYENEGKTVHSLKELETFANKVLDFANKISNEQYWILPTYEIEEDLLRICDITTSMCELNLQKYLKTDALFAKRKIANMPYPWIKGTITILKENDKNKELNK